MNPNKLIIVSLTSLFFVAFYGAVYAAPVALNKSKGFWMATDYKYRRLSIPFAKVVKLRNIY